MSISEVIGGIVKTVEFADDERLWKHYNELPWPEFSARYLEPAMRQLAQEREHANV